MLKIDDATIEIIADNIVYLIKQGRLLKRDAEGGDGWQGKENLEVLWYNYIKRVDPHEKKYIVIIKNLLTKQAKEVFDNIKRYPNNYKKWMFDRKKWLRGFTEAEAKFIVKLYKQEGQKAIDLALKLSRKSYYKAEELPITIAFDVYNPEVTEALVAQTTRFPAGVVGTSEEIIRREIANGLELGESIDKLRKRVTGRLGPTYIKNRAEMIARSETIYASNAGAELGYMQSGVVEGKKWLTAIDERTCFPCTDMNNMTAPLGQPTWEKEGLDIGDVQGKYGLDFDYTEGAMPFPPLHPRCLIDGQIKIYTSKGWRPIRYITIGDLVLTHKGRFKKVTQLHFTPKQKPNVVKLIIDNKRQQMKLSVTENHPILIDNRWIVAKDVKVGDEIDYLAGRCRRCDKLIPYYNKYCSYSCNSKDITERQWSNPKHRENISQKAKEQMEREYDNGTRDKFKITKKANEKTRQLAKEGKLTFQQDWVIEKNKKVTNLPHHRKANSERMRKNNPNCNPEVRKRRLESFKKTMLEHPERHPNYIMAQKGFISRIEKKYKSVLDSLGIFYKQQYPIKQYFVDFAIPDLKVAIEIDGSHWHQDKGKDISRQREIEEKGWFFIRFGEDDINNNIELVRDETKRIILNHKGGYKFIPLKIKRIEKWKLNRPRMLYNLSVEDDESYIANGFVIHNCRCTIVPIVKVVAKKPPRRVTENVLRTNKITSSTKMGYANGVNESTRVKIKGDGEAIFKPQSGEFWPIVDRMGGNGTLGARERIAYTISKEMGIDNVPVTVLRKVDGMPGSVQLWIEKTKARVASSLEFKDYSAYMRAKVGTEYSKENVRMTIFDILIQNPDRHKGNFLIGAKKFYYIDNGYSMPNQLLAEHVISAERFEIEVVAPHMESAFKLLGKTEMSKVKTSLENVIKSKKLEKEMSGFALGNEWAYMLDRASIMVKLIKAGL